MLNDDFPVNPRSTYHALIASVDRMLSYSPEAMYLMHWDSRPAQELELDHLLKLA
jgi:hypothetical protein